MGCGPDLCLRGFKVLATSAIKEESDALGTHRTPGRGGAFWVGVRHEGNTSLRGGMTNSKRHRALIEIPPLWGSTEAELILKISMGRVLFKP